MNDQRETKVTISGVSSPTTPGYYFATEVGYKSRSLVEVFENPLLELAVRAPGRRNGVPLHNFRDYFGPIAS